MKSRIAVLAVCGALLLGLAAWAGEAKVYGSGLKGAEVVSLAKLVADPMAFDGKVVRVEGKVLEVCPKKGCWMQLGGTDGEVRVKVEDDVIVFPKTAKGQQAVAEGKVKVIPMERAQYSQWLEHQAEERGEKFDPASIGDGPYRIVQIEATGAEISGP